jgi:hypothetical protein
VEILERWVGGTRAREQQRWLDGWYRYNLSGVNKHIRESERGSAATETPRTRGL